MRYGAKQRDKHKNDKNETVSNGTKQHHTITQQHQQPNRSIKQKHQHIS